VDHTAGSLGLWRHLAVDWEDCRSQARRWWQFISIFRNETLDKVINCQIDYIICSITYFINCALLFVSLQFCCKI
jgi:hypothetical protein